PAARRRRPPALRAALTPGPGGSRPAAYASRYHHGRCHRSESQAEVSAPRSLLETAETALRQRTGTTTALSITRSFMRMKCAARFTRARPDLGRPPEPIVLLVAPPHDVLALPLVRLGGDVPGDESLHERLSIRGVGAGRVHLEVGGELPVGVGVPRVR